MTALSENLMVGLSAVKIDAEYKSFVNGSCDTLNIGETFADLACDEMQTVSPLVLETCQAKHLLVFMTGASMRMRRTRSI